MSTKPQAKGKGRSPRTRGSPKAAQAARDATASRKRMKARILALTGELSTLRSWVSDLHEQVTGESVRVHPDDMEGNEEE